MSFWVYILHSPRYDRYYVGQSEDPDRRLEFHNSTERGFTARYRPWGLVFKLEHSSREEARKIEKKIKSWKSKKMIRDLIDGKIKI